jgi:HD-GYP domain-containing protein (c-di-GMP phosphodiesterase class II)
MTLGDLLASMSCVLDVTAGQPTGHAIRTCVIGMRIGTAMDLPDEKLQQLYYALLVKDAGASSAAARMYQLFGSNEIAAKRAYNLTDWSNPLEATRFMATHSRTDDGLMNRARRVMRSATDSKIVTYGICRDRAIGAQVAVRSLGFGDEVIEAVKAVDEHFDGSGVPSGLVGLSIPLLSRIMSVAQVLDALSSAMDTESAFDQLKKQSGRRFDPEVVDIAFGFAIDDRFWKYIKEKPRQALLSYETAFVSSAPSNARIDQICHAFGTISDLKTPYMNGHASRVCDYALEIGRDLGIGGDRLRVLRRAALLHDIGKLAVPNGILEKSQKLTPEEEARYRKYPLRTEQLLMPIKGFRRLAAIASAHAERLDGSGFHTGAKAEQIDLDMRILAVADAYDTLTTDQPQRVALPLDKAFRILDDESRAGLDLRCVTALKQRYRASSLTGLQAAASNATDLGIAA